MLSIRSLLYTIIYDENEEKQCLENLKTALFEAIVEIKSYIFRNELHPSEYLWQYLKHQGIELHTLETLCNELKEEKNNIPNESELRGKVNNFDICSINRIMYDLDEIEETFPPNNIKLIIARKDEHRLRFLYSKYKRGYMVEDGFLSVYEDYIKIRNNVMESLLLAYRFRDDIEIFKAVHWIGETYLNAIKEVFSLGEC